MLAQASVLGGSPLQLRPSGRAASRRVQGRSARLPPRAVAEPVPSTVVPFMSDADHLQKWSRESWRNLPALQQPAYPDAVRAANRDDGGRRRRRLPANAPTPAAQRLGGRSGRVCTDRRTQGRGRGTGASDRGSWRSVAQPSCQPSPLVHQPPLCSGLQRWSIRRPPRLTSSAPLSPSCLPARQQEEVKKACAEIGSFPPLVFAGECRTLQARLAKCATGEAFILQVRGRALLSALAALRALLCMRARRPACSICVRTACSAGATCVLPRCTGAALTQLGPEA